MASSCCQGQAAEVLAFTCAGAASGRIVIDGCDAHCARKVLEAADLPVNLHVDVTALGLEKQPENPHFVLHTRRVADHAKTTFTASASKR